MTCKPDWDDDRFRVALDGGLVYALGGLLILLVLFFLVAHLWSSR